MGLCYAHSAVERRCVFVPAWCIWLERIAFVLFRQLMLMLTPKQFWVPSRSLLDAIISYCMTISQCYFVLSVLLLAAAAGKVVRWGIDNRYRDLMPVRSNSSNWKQSFSIHRWQGLVKLNCQVLAEQNVSLSPVRTCCTRAFLACPCAWLVRLNHTYIQLTLFKN